METSSSRALLDQELGRRIRNNPNYSMRAFAGSLGISHSLLSLVLSGKKPVSRKLESKVRALVDDGRGFHDVSLEQFELMSDWCHYPILSLLETPGAKLEANWVARALSISVAEATMAIARLKRFNLIKRTTQGWRQSTKPLKLDNKVSTAGTRKHHHQVLDRAKESLSNDPADVRDFTCVTMAINPGQIEYARKRITRFRRQLMKELEAAGRPTQVYQLAIQLFPVTNFNTKEKK